MMPVRDGLDPRRAVQVLAGRSGARLLGSGYQVTADLVLTAEHVVCDARTLTVRFVDGPGLVREIPAQPVWAHAGVDLAVLRLDTATADVAPVRYGRLEATAGCEAVGYPWFKLRRQDIAADDANPGAFRESHHARGTVSPHSNRRTGTLELTVTAPLAHPDPARSAWEGMSGAAVFADHLLIGVLSENHWREGPGWLTANPVAGWYHHPSDEHFTALHALLDLPSAHRLPAIGAAGDGASAPKYLEQLAESYQWLELQGIREAGSLRIELEKVYVALRAEPESEYDLRHLANLHETEVREAAGGTAVDLIEPERLAELDARNVRETYRPKRDEDRRAKVAEVQTIADAFRLHNRAVLLGGPGSGKTTLGRWLALQLARGMLAQLPCEVAPEAAADLPRTVRIHLPPGEAASLSRSHFAAAFPVHGSPPAPADKPVLIRVDRLPARGVLTFFGEPVERGQTFRLDQVEQLVYVPAGDECGNGYAHLRYTAAGDALPPTAGAIVIDVGVHILVPLAQIDPDQPGGPESHRPVDLGPARMPVYLRLAHFARELAERERNDQPTISLIEYLGRDPDSSGLADGGSPEARNAMLRGFLERGSAVVILDGLDELPETNRRGVLLKIQHFLETSTQPNAPDAAGVPWRSPGNQVIVTSRYVGYKLMPLRGGCAHFGIQPMQRPAVEHFARAWTRAVSAELGAERPDRPTAEALIDEIYDDTRPAIRELATNPLLITILATVYWADGRLPDQRAGVYDRVVENLLAIWLNRPQCRTQALRRHELLAALEPLAATMQADHSSNGLVSLDRIAELIGGPLAQMRHTTASDRAFKPVLDALLVTIRTHVGLLAEQSSGNYAFFHRTFQEFLAARHLLSAGERAAEEILERLDDPLWREPLLLALGLLMASPEWGGPQARTRLLEGVLAGDDRDPLIPRSAMLVVSALPTLDKVPRRVIDRIVGQLLTCYAFSQRQAQAEKLREEITEVFARLRDGPAAEAVAEAVGEAIRLSAAEHNLAGAAAEILLRLDWFTTDAVDALLQVAHRDEPDLGWPVHWALLAALGQSPAGQPSVKPGAPRSALNVPRLVAANLPMRRLLESNPDLTAFVRGDVDWLWLLIALYGGLGRARVREQVLTYQKRVLDELRTNEDDAGDKSAADPPPLLPPIPPIDFCPGDIVHDLADTELSRSVLRQLRARRPARELAELFHRTWQRGADPAGCAEAVVALAALGQDVAPLVQGALADGQTRPAARAALDRFGWLRALLREPVIRSTQTAARTLPRQAPAQRQLDLLRIVITARAAAGGGPLPVSDTIPALRFIGAAAPSVRDGVDAEEWAYLFSGLAGQTLAEVGGALDPRAAVDLREPDRVMRGWAELARARNHLALPRLWWPQRILAPRCDTPVERYLAMLEDLLIAPPECDGLAGHVLGRCGSVLDEEPALVWETLAICSLRGETFTAAYLASATGEHERSAAAGELARRWDRGRPTAEQAEELRAAVQTILLRKLDVTAAASRTEVEAARILLKHAAQITDPYLRFRALRLLSRTAGGARFVIWRSGPDLITDPHDHARALEWVLMTIPGMRIGLEVGELIDLDETIRQFLLIEDPENRARAQCRLAMLVPERLGELLDAAAESLGSIADPARRAETIEEIRFTMGGIAQLARGFDEAAGALPDQWLRDKALGRASRLINTYRADYAAGALVWQLAHPATTGGATEYRHPYPTGLSPWGVLYLDATAAEVGSIAPATTGDAADWELLLGPDWQSGVDALIDSAADGALSVTVREASVLNRIVQSGRSARLERLWGYLECPDPQAAAIATRWATADASAERWKALVQAETGLLTPQSLDLLVDLLCEATDRLRQRTVLALHGPTPWGTNRNRRWFVSRVGASTIETIAEHALRDDLVPRIQGAINWMQCNIHHDDADALGRWLSEAAADPGSPAGWIVESLESVEEPLVPLLLEALPSMPPAAQRKLLVGLAQMATSYRVLDPYAETVRSAIAAVAAHVRREVWFIPDRAAACLKAVAAAAAWPDEESRLDVAQAQLDRAKVWLDDACLADTTDCYKRLKDLGESHYINHREDGYWQQATEAAAELAENEDALRVLLSWLESLAFANTSGDLNTDLCAILLTATDALAQVSPNAFTASADPDVWEPILTEWVETAEHWPARLSALRLLGLLRRVTPRVVAALRSAMNDNFHIQQAAYGAVQDFHTMKGDITAELVELLGDPDAGVAGSTARLLLNLARGEGATTDRRRILRGLQEAATGPTKGRNVYLMAESELVHALSIRFVDRLDRILYQTIFEISGL